MELPGELIKMRWITLVPLRGELAAAHLHDKDLTLQETLALQESLAVSSPPIPLGCVETANCEPYGASKERILAMERMIIHFRERTTAPQVVK